MKQRFRQINADPTILPHTNITWTIFDDQFLSQRGFFGALEAIRDHGAQVRGAHTSCQATSGVWAGGGLFGSAARVTCACSVCRFSS